MENKREKSSEKNKLQYIECSNCKAVFDSRDNFTEYRTFIGINKFRCKVCKKEFLYPSNSKYGAHLMIGIILWIVSITLTPPPGDIIAIGIVASLGFAGFLLSIQGLWGVIQNSSLKSKNPQWENRLHNTERSK
jgi:hypothetical protein